MGSVTDILAISLAPAATGGRRQRPRGAGPDTVRYEPPRFSRGRKRDSPLSRRESGLPYRCETENPASDTWLRRPRRPESAVDMAIGEMGVELARDTARLHLRNRGIHV